MIPILIIEVIFFYTYFIHRYIGNSPNASIFAHVSLYKPIENALPTLYN